MKTLLIATTTVIGLASINGAQAEDRFGFSMRLGNRGSIHFGSGSRYGSRDRSRTVYRPESRRPVSIPVPVVVPTRTPLQASGRSQNEAFGARLHVDELAVQLTRQVTAALWEMHLHHRHSPGFAATYREMYSLLNDAKHVHELAHEEVRRPRLGERDHIARDLLNMDELLHHVEDDIAGWSSHSSRHHGHGSSLHSQVSTIGQTLHHLLTDYGVTGRSGADSPPPPPANNVAPPAPLRR